MIITCIFALNFIMSIPQSILPIHIAKAIKDVKKEGPIANRSSTEYVLLVEGIALEPKRVISRAAFYAIKRELKADEFSSGKEAIKFLKDRGFQVVKGATR